MVHGCLIQFRGGVCYVGHNLVRLRTVVIERLWHFHKSMSKTHQSNEEMRTFSIRWTMNHAIEALSAQWNMQLVYPKRKHIADTHSHTGWF